VSVKKGSIADELKAKARAAEDGRPVMMTLNGWSFGLSLGVTPTPSREQYEAFYDSVHERIGGGPKPTYEEMVAAMEVARLKGERGGQWIFSACLHPRGRGSKEEDWHFLGKMTAALGAPEGSLKTPFETTDSNAVHYWMWDEPIKVLS
jgi:hypothetical protein